ncbi:hypothetical protein L6R46_06090 [Myxococcota bacterium]|nr:hypothetical protein [Myxococcota bacterium]
MIGADLAVPLGALCAALAFAVGDWLAERRSAHLRRLWERVVIDREAQASRADDEQRLREAAVDHMGAYAAQVQEDRAEIATLRGQFAQAEAEAAEARARVLLAWHEADQLEAMLNTAEDELDAARRELRQADELAEELAEGTERQLAEEVIAARVSGWLVEDQARRYEARIARRASLSVSRRSAPSAVHGPDPGACDDAAEKKS